MIKIPIVEETPPRENDLEEVLGYSALPLTLPFILQNANQLLENKLGPETKFGRRFYSEEILDMTIVGFVSWHHGFEQEYRVLLNYFGAVIDIGGHYIGWEEPMRKILEVQPESVIGIKNVDESTVNGVKDFLGDHYGLSLGRKYEPKRL